MKHVFSIPEIPGVVSFLPGVSSGRDAQCGSFGRPQPPPPAWQHIHIPKCIPAPPFLQHPSLTPGQKRYLRGVAAAHSEGQVARLIQQHYFNIVHRCIRTGPAPHLSGDPLRLLAARHTSEPFADWKPGTVQSESFISEKESQSRTRRKGRLGPERRTVLPSIDGSKRRAAATMPRAHKKRANKAGKKAPVRGTSKHYKDDSAEDSLDELLKDRFTDDEDVL